MKVLSKMFYILMLLFVCSWQVQAESLNNQAKQALTRGNMNAAGSLLNKQIKLKPDDYQAWFLLGVAEARGKHFHQAIEAFRRVIELRDNLAEPHNNLAVIYNELGDVKAAVHELEQSLKKHPGYAVAEENIADLYIKLALQYYKKALIKNDNLALTQRYTRLLQVRDTHAKARDLNESTQVSVSNKTLKTIAKHVVLDEKSVAVEVVSVNKSKEAQEVLLKVELWRVAWQEQNLKVYFSMYASDYVPTKKYGSLAAWKVYKEQVIVNKSYIQVDLRDITVELSKDKKEAEVRFNQSFRSNSYNGNSVKVLKLEKRQQGWKIVHEAPVS